MFDTPKALARSSARSAVRRIAATERGASLLARLRDDIERALDDTRYGPSYYASDMNDPTWGYADYTRATSNADALATMVWSWFGPSTALDVGCAAGFLVEALVDLGVDTQGTDLSDAAFQLGAPSVRHRLSAADLRSRIPADDHSFEIVTAFETLEHLRPHDVPAALREVARLSAGFVVATIPSVGANDSGPDGWFDGKVRPDRLDHYRAAGEPDAGPVPFEDLAVDSDGRPVSGHLTIASYAWWTARFEEAGLVRDVELERRLHLDLARYGLTEFLCLYVLRRPEVPGRSAPAQTPEAIAATEERFRLLEHGAPAAHVDKARAALAEGGLEPRPLAGADATS